MKSLKLLFLTLILSVHGMVKINAQERLYEPLNNSAILGTWVANEGEIFYEINVTEGRILVSGGEKYFSALFATIVIIKNDQIIKVRDRIDGAKSNMVGIMNIYEPNVANLTYQDFEADKVGDITLIVRPESPDLLYWKLTYRRKSGEPEDTVYEFDIPGNLTFHKSN